MDTNIDGYLWWMLLNGKGVTIKVLLSEYLVGGFPLTLTVLQQRPSDFVISGDSLGAQWNRNANKVTKSENTTALVCVSEPNINMPF